MRKKNSTPILKNTKDNKLSIQFNLDGFSFSIQDSISKKDIYFCAYTFKETQATPENLLLKIDDIFKNDTHLQQDFSTVIVIHQNNLSALVPNQYFNEDKLSSYLNFNIKTLSTDFITFDEISSIDAKNVYVPYVNINNYLFNNFGEFDYKHHSSVLIDKLILRNKNESKTMYVNVSKTTFDIVVLENKKLVLYNSFAYTSKEDFLYYILFVAEQLQLDTNEFPLYLMGDIIFNSELYKITYTYIKNLNFLGSKNPIFKELNLETHTNFILLG
ncbi:DUF3822 family protein [Polaribacter haliotis]|uniref:DUF3822 family protein n=1 Tax=Polaribacter haliotis TaxID=1888915 RepID=A0A7L8AIL6_9FLAO|nr:DUF3822 family protein [Polaribacter haliotis]QOD61794.1 DUF3822 family protein [Polaribacter haliotis]